MISNARSFVAPPPKESPLPPWLPPSRVIGGFYVLRTLGAGAVGSVFIARPQSSSAISWPIARPIASLPAAEGWI